MTAVNLRTITHAGLEVHGTVNGAITPWGYSCLNLWPCCC